MSIEFIESKIMSVEMFQLLHSLGLLDFVEEDKSCFLLLAIILSWIVHCIGSSMWWIAGGRQVPGFSNVIHFQNCHWEELQEVVREFLLLQVSSSPGLVWRGEMSNNDLLLDHTFISTVSVLVLITLGFCFYRRYLACGPGFYLSHNLRLFRIRCSVVTLTRCVIIVSWGHVTLERGMSRSKKEVRWSR